MVGRGKGMRPRTQPPCRDRVTGHLLLGGQADNEYFARHRRRLEWCRRAQIRPVRPVAGGPAMSAFWAGSPGGAEGGGEGPEVVVARLPFAGRGGPVQGVCMMGVSQDVAVECLGELAIVVVGEL